MAPVVQLWSGREVRWLRDAKRMTIQASAAHPMGAVLRVDMIFTTIGCHKSNI